MDPGQVGLEAIEQDFFMQRAGVEFRHVRILHRGERCKSGPVSARGSGAHRNAQQSSGRLTRRVGLLMMARFATVLWAWS